MFYDMENVQPRNWYSLATACKFEKKQNFGGPAHATQLKKVLSSVRSARVPVVIIHVANLSVSSTGSSDATADGWLVLILCIPHRFYRAKIKKRHIVFGSKVSEIPWKMFCVLFIQSFRASTQLHYVLYENRKCLRAFDAMNAGLVPANGLLRDQIYWLGALWRIWRAKMADAISLMRCEWDYLLHLNPIKTAPY